MKEYRVSLTDEQAAYLEATLMNDYSNHTEMFRGVVRDHRQYRELLGLDVEHDFDAAGSDTDDS